MLKKISVGVAGDLNTVTMKLGCVLMAWALYLSLGVLWVAQMLLAASFETLQCEGPVCTEESSCHTEDDLTDAREAGFQVKAYTFSEPFHLIVSYGASSSAAPPTLNPAPQKSAAPGTAPEEAPGPLPPPPTPSSEDPGFSSPLGMPDPHLYHQMGLLLKHMQDVRVLLGHLLMELRELSGHRKPGTTKATAE
ncbi:Fc receptor like A [Homo sapiens]|uniref:Isoform 13 of Fc receptor-like A n=1 Tax=Homo sapiens TaxID=9606 RepID=Q7L513-13|nr:Fc receptor-like and mucin-like 1, isoform CRA_b [Homo sapiens]KAI2520154.1 Fc receptor like A [Homo sapiens]KAI4083670.1 Fc receptor like A [Homo sapiens]|eukprot:NP_001171802.1 Fc receptor-like A isoform 6 precursor [Homo sapiens]